MPRPAAVADRDLLASALRIVGRDGPRAATVSAIANGAGVPTGSLYHRFPSRDVLLARLWLDTVEDFQRGFLAAVDLPDPAEAAEQAALHTPAWCRDNVDAARLLLVWRREHLLAAGWPPEVRDRAAGVNDAAAVALRRYTRARYGVSSRPAVRRVAFALVDAPAAAVRRHLADGERPPPYVDDLVRATCRAVLDLP